MINPTLQNTICNGQILQQKFMRRNKNFFYSRMIVYDLITVTANCYDTCDIATIV